MKNKLNLKSKKLKYGSIAAVITVVVVAVVVLFNIVLSMLSNRLNLKIDLTSDNVFEISDISKDYLKTINQDIEIVALCDELVFQTSESIYYKQAYEVLQKYALNSDNITLKFVDMTKNPTYTEKFSKLYKGDITEYSIVVSSANRIRVISINDLFNTEMNQYTYSNEITSSKAEQVLTSAVMYVTDVKPMSVAVLSVDTASGSTENISSLLQSNGFDVTYVDPLSETIPMDADMLVIDAPVNDFSETLIEQLYKFMENDGKYGKNMIYLAAYQQNSTTNIDAFLAEWGIKVEKSVIAESDQNNLVSPTSPYSLNTFIQTNDYSSEVSQPTLPVVSYQACPVTLLFDSLSNVSTKSLLTTADTSYAITAEMMEKYQNGEDYESDIEYKAYNTIAISSKYTFNENNEQMNSNVLVFGSSSMLDPYFTGLTYYNNGDYFVSIIAKMTGKSSGVSIVAKDLSAKTFNMDAAKYYSNRNIFMFILPAVILIFGLIVWIRRRNK